jgi:putative transposase
MAIPQDRNLRWSLDFVMDKLLAAGASASSPYLGRRLQPGVPFGMAGDTSLTAPRVVCELDRIVETRGCPRMIVSDNGPS